MELAAGRAAGYVGLEAVEEAFAGGSILPAEPMQTAEHALFAEFLRTLGAGEASCIALARHRDGVAVIDDRTGRRRCSELRIPVTGTIGILTALCVDRTLPPRKPTPFLA